MEETNVKSTSGGTMLELKIKKDDKLLFDSKFVVEAKIFYYKICQVKKIQFIIWRFVFC